MKSSFKRTFRHLWHRYHVYIYVVIGAACIVLALGALWLASIPLPDIQSFSSRKVVQSTKIFDRNGELLYTLQDNERRTVVNSSKISLYIKNATVAIEDPDFYDHNGIIPKAILRAVLVNIKDAEYTQGGSTITQQVIKNSLLTQDKSIIRKMKEWVLAVKLEKYMSKDDILAVYLNEVGYGGNVYGVEEASKGFFGKTAEEVTLAEAAYLAALPQSPSRLSPYGKNKKDLDTRKDTVLWVMRNKNFITEEEYQNALKEVVTFKERGSEGIKAPHFVFYIKDYLQEKYGEDVALNGGLDVYTTLDLKLQQKLEEIVLRHALDNKKNYNASNASAVVLDATTGQILAMVGSRNYFDKEIDGKWNVSIAKRQPGSTFKPIIYTLAFSKGYTADTVLFDLPTEFNPKCDPLLFRESQNDTDGDCYHPHNYNGVHHGPVTLKEALAQSINIPAVKLLYLVGLNNALDFAHRLGITSLVDTRDYGLSLVLGGGEVSLLEMAGAYAVFSQEGMKHNITGILEIKDRQGEVIEKYENVSERVIEAEPTRITSYILSENSLRAPAFGVNNQLRIPGRTVAVKTGTTNDIKDVWTIGYTPEIVVGVWGGNNDNTSISGRLASIVIVPLWNEITTYVLKDRADKSFNPPLPTDPTVKPVLRGIWRGGEVRYIDSRTGDEVDEDTPIDRRKEVITGGVHSILYWINKSDPNGPAPTEPGRDNQFKNWETSLMNSVYGQLNNQTKPEEKPTEGDE